MYKLTLLKYRLMIGKRCHQSSLHNYFCPWKHCARDIQWSFFLQHHHFYICLVYALWKSYTMPIWRDLYTQNLIDFLILYNDWQGLHYKQDDSILSLRREWRICKDFFKTMLLKYLHDFINTTCVYKVWWLVALRICN